MFLVTPQTASCVTHLGPFLVKVRHSRWKGTHLMPNLMMAYYSCGNLYLTLVQKNVCPFSFSYTNTNQFAIALPAAAEGEKTVYASIFYQFLVSRFYLLQYKCADCWWSWKRIGAYGMTDPGWFPRQLFAGNHAVLPVLYFAKCRSWGLITFCVQ